MIEGAEATAERDNNGVTHYRMRTIAKGDRSIALGAGSQALADDSIAIGTANVVTGNGSGAIGDPNVVSGTGSYVLGNNNHVHTNNTFVVGNDVTQTVENSVVLGNQSAAVSVHTTATGGNYTFAGANDANVAGVKDVVGIVSVGKEGQTRQIQNVSAGVVSATSTDAINGSQLYYTNRAVGQLTQAVNKHNLDLRAGLAGVNAAASLPQVYLPGKSMVAASVGAYKGQSAVAIGYSRSSDNGKLILKLQGNANTRGDVGAGVGIGYQW